jgi:hypothetical protein
MEILDTMDIPQARRDVSNLSNVRWLMRNLGANNSGHPHFSAAITQLKQILRGDT